VRPAEERTRSGNRAAVRAFLGLGANLGDRLANLQRAADLLGRKEGIAVVASSRVFETEPVGGPPQPHYLNAVIEASTTRSPRSLLDACLDVELSMGRERIERWGPRVIDIDVLTYGRERVDEPGLEIPHPRMHERGFVLLPLLELTEDPPLPGDRLIGSVRLGGDPLRGIKLFGPPLALRQASV
jgi:2-amino-4-hydroxy-6-hydroxymethyldihydropteridine diphosphokinase